MNINDSTTTTQSNTKKRKEDFEFVTIGPNGKDELGKGSYGCVKLARDKSTGQLYAIKIVNFISYIYKKKIHIRSPDGTKSRFPMSQIRNGKFTLTAAN